MKYPKVTHKLPVQFEEKIEWDDQLECLLAAPVVILSKFKNVKEQQELSRYSCIKHIKIQRGGGGSAGSGRGA